MTLSYKFTKLIEVMIGLLLNGLGVVKRNQDGEVNDRPRKTVMVEFARLAAKNVENEFNDRFMCGLNYNTLGGAHTE